MIDFGVWYDDLVALEQRASGTYAKLRSIKCAVWGIVRRHDDLKTDAEAVFAAVAAAVAQKSVAGAFALVASVERIVSDAQRDYADDRDQIRSILDQLKALAA